MNSKFFMTAQSSKGKKSLNFSLVIFVLFLIASIVLLAWQLVPKFLGSGFSLNKTQISVVVAPELESVLKPITEEFSNQNPYQIKLQAIASGEAKTGIEAKTLSPDLFLPTSSVWGELINYESGQNLADMSNSPSLATSPVGIAIWESKLNLLKKKFNRNSFDFSDILEVSKTINGWQSIDSSQNRAKIYAGFTNPQISTTGLSALIGQYYSASQTGGKISEKLSLDEVKNQSSQTQIESYQQIIRHYSANTVIFRDYLNRGSEYIDLLPLAENDLIFVNKNRGSGEKLQMIYPTTGSVVHNYPLIPINYDNQSQEQKNGVKAFKAFLVSEKVQKTLLENGFRPNKDSKVPLSSPVTSDFGVDPNEPKKTLELPTSEVISAIQTNWDFVKKKSRILLTLDTSGSMQGSKLNNAKKALNAFSNNITGKNEVGLVNFGTDVNYNTDPVNLENNKAQLQAGIGEVQAQGSTALYDGIAGAMDQLEKLSGSGGEVTNAVVVLSDGADTSSNLRLKDLVSKIENSQKSPNPILVLPIAYGNDADLNTLNSIARASKTTVQKGETDSIDRLLQDISSYF